MPSAPHSAPAPGGGPRSGHRHTTRCYWDVQGCGWHCPRPAAGPAAPSALDAVEPAAPAPSVATPSVAARA
ncbi:hypothetical protein LWC35_08140 [Pseudonocardia kujensis]|uniref:hypothetical protein n=1 Tax=Pseudonocardia kujensis TaxID=1128675 RepID=UPI001E36626B|nr:hypothetical protein [Pseudonocardia kujensis]MCE0762882.1 hypothetical protein [Pseudonocardia kujensis]